MSWCRDHVTTVLDCARDDLATSCCASCYNLGWFTQAKTVIETAQQSTAVANYANLLPWKGTVKPVLKITREIGTTWGLRTPTLVDRSIHYIEITLRTKTTSEFRTVFPQSLWVSLIPTFYCNWLGSFLF